MQIFEKLSQILGLRLIVKFCSVPQNRGPEHLADPINRKILHALLINSDGNEPVLFRSYPNQFIFRVFRVGVLSFVKDGCEVSWTT